MKRTILILIVLALFSQCGFAAGEYLFYPVASDNWADGANWYVDGTPGIVPSSTSLAVISDYTGWAADAVLDSPGVCDQLYLGNAGSGSLDVQSTLDVTTYLYAGIVSGTGTMNVTTGGSVNTPNFSLGHTSPGVMTMDDGNLTVSMQLIIGNAADGQLAMTGGSLDTNQLYIGLGSTGFVDLDGGTITAGYLEFNQAGGTGVLDMAGSGKLVLTNAYFAPEDWMGAIGNYMAIGSILNAQANIVGDTVEITAVPEPATLALLSLGFGLIRRKRS